MKTLRKKVEERKRIGEISSSEDSEEEVPNKVFITPRLSNRENEILHNVIFVFPISIYFN